MCQQKSLQAGENSFHIWLQNTKDHQPSVKAGQNRVNTSEPCLEKKTANSVNSGQNSANSSEHCL